MTIYENVMLNWDGDGDYAQTVVPLSEVEEQNRERAHLVRENARMREALQCMLPRYVELFEHAGLGPARDSIAVEMAEEALGIRTEDSDA